MMTDSQLRDIFSRFENLNLVNLRHSLVNGRYSMGSWSTAVWPNSRMDLCPLSHGRRLVGVDPNPDSLLCPVEQAFWRWFDGVKQFGGPPTESAIDRVIRLLCVIGDIWRERLADADAVQSMICGFVAQSGEHRILTPGDAGSFPAEAFVSV